MKLGQRLLSMSTAVLLVVATLPISSFAVSNSNYFTENITKFDKIEYTEYESEKPELSSREVMIKEEIKEIAKNDVESAAELIESAENKVSYEIYLKAALDLYYSDVDTNQESIDIIKKLLDEKAIPIIERYDAAAAERAAQSSLNYEATSVVVSFDKNATDNYIESYLEDNYSGYEVLFDGSIDPNENLPAEKLVDLKDRINRMESNRFDKIYSVNLRLDQTTDIAVEELLEEGAINDVGKDYFEFSDVVYDGDPKVSSQYYLDRINVDDAYPIFDNSFAEQWIAVLDDGIDMNHEDLKANLLSDYSYDIPKGKLLKNCSAKYTGSHGTNVSGVIAAVSGNHKGIMGVASGYGDNYNKVMMLKVTNDDDVAYTSSFISGIEYAIENGASVINISWTSSTPLASYQKIIDTATDCEVTVVASAGNDNNSILRYPAAYNNVISVAAVDEYNNKASFSSYGSTVDYAAPGVNIYTTSLSNTYDSVNGTSFSAPITAASVAMLKAFTNNPTTDKIERILDHTVTKVSDSTIGVGVINIGLAMEYARYIEFKNYTPIVSKVVSNSSGTATVRAKISAANQFSPTGFVIYRSSTINGTYAKVKDINYDQSFLVGNWDVVQWKNTGLTSNKTYFYKIRCYVKYDSGRRYTTYSNVVSVKVS